MTTMLEAEKLSSLIEMIYDAALAPELWGRFMATGRQAFDATGSTFLQLESAHPEKSIVDLRGIDPHYEVEALERRENEDYWYLEAKRMPGGSIMYGTEMISRDAMHQTPFYQEVVCHLDIEYMLGCVVTNDKDRQSYFSFLRGNSADNFNVEEKRAMRLLLPHVQKAYFLQRQLAQRESFKQALEASPYGVVVLDIKHKALFVNHLAEQTFVDQDGLFLRKGKVKLGNHRDQVALERSIEHALSPLERIVPNIRTPVAVMRPSGKLAYQIEVYVLNPNSETITLMDNASCLLLIHDPCRPVTLSPDKIQAIYGLTQAEARICMHLLEGYSLQDTADKLNITRNTAKTHLKHIFEKCQVSSQNQLIRLLALGLR